MPRRRRRIISKKCYEIGIRARAGLPLVAYDTIKLLLSSAIARTQRDDKVLLCHDIWNGSHAHIIVVALDSQKCTQFYGEIQKRITDALKRFLGLEYLDLWEGSAMVAEIADLNEAVERMVYIYTNPAKDCLVETIEEFPGLSSWNEFKRSLDKPDAVTEEDFPWIRLASIPQLPNPRLSKQEDQMLSKKLREDNKKLHPLKRHINAWMRCFGITEADEVKETNERILRRIQETEEAFKQIRAEEGTNVMGIAYLESQPILKPHKPKPKERNIFVLCSIAELRISIIEDSDAYDEQCNECLSRWRNGEFHIEWPPGAFKPPLPPLVNLLP